MAGAACGSPLLARPICLEVEEGKLAVAPVAAAPVAATPVAAVPVAAPAAPVADAVPTEAPAEAPAPRTRVYVSGAVLQTMPYFSARLSERWEEGKEVLFLRLPDGCSLAALCLLFERLHFTRGHWDEVELGVVLQMVQLAGMFLAESDGLLSELSQLLHGSVRSQQDIDTVTAFVERVEAPACVAQLARNLARRRLSTLLGDAELTAMLKNVLASGDAATALAVRKLLGQRARRDGESSKRNAAVLQSVLQVGPATSCISMDRLTVVLSESAGRWSEWVERPAPGLGQVLQIAANFALAQPEHLCALAPLMFPKFPVSAQWTRSALLTDLLKRTIRDILDNSFVPWAAPSPRSVGAPPHDEGEAISGLLSAVIGNGHEDLLHNNVSLANAVARAAAISSAAVESICTALLKLKSSTLSSFVTSGMLESIAGPSRQKLCLAVLPNMHTLRPDVKESVLAEIDADDTENEDSLVQAVPAEDVSAKRAAKRPRL